MTAPVCPMCRKRACESRGLVNGRRLYRTRCEVCRKATPYPSGRSPLVVELSRMPVERFEPLLATVLARRAAQSAERLWETPTV